MADAADGRNGSQALALPLAPAENHSADAGKLYGTFVTVFNLHKSTALALRGA